MTAYYAAVWLDHREAKIYELLPEGFELNQIKAPRQHLTRKAEEQGRHGDQAFFHEVAHALEGAGEVLVVGPSSAKLDFVRHAHQHHPSLDKKIVGVETLDHPTDNQLVAYVRHYFLTKIR